MFHVEQRVKPVNESRWEPRPEVVEAAKILAGPVKAILRTRIEMQPWSLARAICDRYPDLEGALDGERMWDVLRALHVAGFVRLRKGHGGEPMYSLTQNPDRPVRTHVDWRGNPVPKERRQWK